MLDIQQIQIIAQLVDNMEILSGKLEESFNKNKSEEFVKTKKEIIKCQRKINEMTG